MLNGGNLELEQKGDRKEKQKSRLLEGESRDVWSYQPSLGQENSEVRFWLGYIQVLSLNFS